MNIKQAQQKLDNIYTEMSERSKNGFSNFDNIMCVQIIDCHEGTVLFYESAFAVLFDEYWFIITEHHGSTFYHDADIIIRIYERVYDIPLPNKMPWES